MKFVFLLATGLLFLAACGKSNPEAAIDAAAPEAPAPEVVAAADVSPSADAPAAVSPADAPSPVTP